jgi:hypothetical protein
MPPFSLVRGQHNGANQFAGNDLQGVEDQTDSRFLGADIARVITISPSPFIFNIPMI